jgi:hypothetical protein
VPRCGRPASRLEVLPASSPGISVGVDTDDPLADYTDKLDQRFVDRQDSGGSTAA